MERGIEWAAGLFEGEGCFSIHRKKRADNSVRLSLLIDLSSSDRDVVDEFVRVCGGTVYENAHTERQTVQGHKVMYRVRMQGKKAEELGWRLMPYLMKRRRERFIEIMMQVRENNNPT